MKKLCFLVLIMMLQLFVLPTDFVVNAQTVEKITVNLNGVKSIGKTIQASLDRALEDQSGNVLYEITLPKGTYQLDTLLKVFSYTTIKMEGCTLVRDADKSMIRIGYEDTRYTGYNGIHDIAIIGGCIDGNVKMKCSTSMVRMGHGANITIRNVTFRNAYNSHHMEMAGCRNVLIEDCTFTGYYTNKKDVTNSGNYEALQLDVLHEGRHFPKYPILDDTPCRDVTVKGCTFEKLQRGLGIHSGVAGSYFTNIQFIDNTFTDIRGYAIIATNFQSSEISGNVIKNCGAGILFRSMVQGNNNFYTPVSGKVTIDNDANSVIKNNIIQVTDRKYKTTAYGISLYGQKLTKKTKDVPKGDYTLHGVTICDNTITMNNSGYGIWLQGTKKCTVENNSVVMNIKASASGKGNSDCIRLVRSKNAVINNNTFTQKKINKKTKEACGIAMTTDSDATITKNKINNSPKDGIFLNSKCKATVKNNTIKKTGRYGLNVAGKSTMISKKNKITKCKKRKTNASGGGKIKG
ncbi:MAG: right-handed parallel beta-helix repeat-containing protein [Lachnospiraceae bacterium]|nr:right-handed parallel beta-helix repeat-containing protein [Lachnospiraceae bacterium]